MVTTPQAIMDLIAGSGNNFHAKVARWFNTHGWHTTVSPYYMDQSQSKARELDLVVEKLWPILGRSRQQEGNVLVRLYVECKFVASESVFWFSPKNYEAAMELVCSLGPFRKDNLYTKKHHYLATSSNVANLFASNNNKTQENEPFFKAINQSLNAMIAMRGQSSSYPRSQRKITGKLVVMEHPVVVCSSFSKMYAVDFLTESQPTNITDNFQMEVQYAFIDHSGKGRNEYFLIDFVEFDKLESFEKALDEGARAVR